MFLEGFLKLRQNKFTLLHYLSFISLILLTSYFFRSPLAFSEVETPTSGHSPATEEPLPQPSASASPLPLPTPSASPLPQLEPMDPLQPPSHTHWVERPITFLVDTGLRLNFHPTQTTLETAPVMLFAEGNFTVLFKKRLGVYIVLSTTFFGSTIGSTISGAGLKVPVFTVSFASFPSSGIASTPKKYFSGAVLYLSGDADLYSYKGLPADSLLPADGFAYRVGGGINWYFKNPGTYLSTNALFGRNGRTYFLAPFVGIGFEL